MPILNLMEFTTKSQNVGHKDLEYKLKRVFDTLCKTKKVCLEKDVIFLCKIDFSADAACIHDVTE